MIEEIAAFPALGGLRGQPRADLDAFALDAVLVTHPLTP